MNHKRALHDFPRAVNPRVRAAYDCRQRGDEQDARGAKIPRDCGSRDNERFTTAGQLISVKVTIFWHRLGPKSSLSPGMNDQLISVLAPDRDILHFEPRLVIALNPLEQKSRSKRMSFSSRSGRTSRGTNFVLSCISLPGLITGSKVFCAGGEKCAVAKLWSYFSITSRDGIPS